MKEFVKEHPWMTFFLGLAALNTIGYIVRGDKVVVNVPPKAPPAPGVATLTQGVIDHPMMAWTKPVTSMMRG
jgi:hypothetical protein